MKNPFKYGSRVSGGAFFDREKIMRDMMGVLDGGNNVVLYGPWPGNRQRVSTRNIATGIRFRPRQR